MSEYQYYEFQAIDQPLNERAMADLRAITSRADITPTSLVNVYHFGDFKGNADRLMDRYFDAHLYLANWGSRRLMLRLPAELFPLTSAKPYAVPYILNARSTKTDVVLDFQSESEEGDADFEEGEGWLTSLIQLRSDLLAGDIRCLYLGWLAGVQSGEIDESTVEPPVPPGLGQLSASLQRFTKFIRLAPDLVEIAASASEGEPPGGPSVEELAAWVAELPRAETDRMILRLMCGEDIPSAGELLRRFREDQGRRELQTDRDQVATASRRTASELIEAQDRLTQEKKRKAAKRAANAEARRERERTAARARHLDALIGREEELWQQVEEAIQARKPKEYDHAVEVLKDLHDLSERTSTEDEVTKRIHELRERHRSKSSLMQRLNRATLPQ